MNSVTLDLVMLGLLCGVIYYSWRLNRNIKTLKKASQELDPILRNFSVVISQISQTIERLKSASKDINTDFLQQLPKASALRDDLTFLVEHSEQLGKRLDSAIEQSKKAQRDLELSHQKGRQSMSGLTTDYPVCKEQIDHVLDVRKPTEVREENPLKTADLKRKSTSVSQVRAESKVDSLIDRGLLATLSKLR